MKAIVIFDIDGVLATGSVEDVYSDAAGWAYENCEPCLPGIQLLKELHRCGCQIILHSSRMEYDRVKTEMWLDAYAIPYDSLVLGKPYGDIYIDDKAFHFTGDFDSNDVPNLVQRILTRTKHHK
jgi:hypothetical protein